MSLLIKIIQVTLIAVFIKTAQCEQQEATLSPEEQALEDRYMNVMDCYCTNKNLPNNVIEAMEFCKKKHLNKECRRKCELEVFGAQTPLNKMRHLICEKALETKKNFLRCYTREYKKGVQEGRWQPAQRGTVIPQITQQQFDRMSAQEKARREAVISKVRDELKKKFLEKLGCMEKAMGMTNNQKCRYS